MSALQNRLSSEDEANMAHDLHLAEHILREDGRHVLLDMEEAGLWVFSLSCGLNEGIAQRLGLDGLEREKEPCLSVSFVR